MEPALTGWSEFNVAVAGAGAALAGLLIVAISVNIREILQAPTLPARAASSIAALVLGVAAACLALIPDQPLPLLGVEIAAGSALLWVFEAFATRAIVREPGQGASSRVMKVAVGVLPALLFSVGGVQLLAGRAEGYAWVAAASVIAIVAAVLFSWVALVEILR